MESGSLVPRQVGGTRSGEKSIHNFLSRPEVTPQEIIATAAQRTAKACAARRIVAAQDTTEINFKNRDRARKGLGPAGDGKTPGFFCHGMVAGYEVKSVTIKADEDAEGRAVYECPLVELEKLLGGLDPSYIDPDDVDGARMMQLVGHAIIVSLAGSLAQKRYDPESDWQESATGAGAGELMHRAADMRGVLHLIEDVWGRGKVADTYRAHMEARAENLVEREWSRIERLAHALVQRETLTGYDDIRAAAADPAILAA